LTNERRSAPIRIWALLGARAGDNDQVLALAKALGTPFEIKELKFNGLRRLGPRILGRSLLSLTGRSRKEILAERPPDLTISAGHRSVAVVQGLRRRSGGRTRSIHIGFPRISPGHFDLVITTPQYPIAPHPHLLRVPFALTRTATSPTAKGDEAALAALPAPRRLLLVGGPTLFWTIDRTALLKTVEQMLDDASRHGGSVIVTTSPRTPAEVREVLASALANASVPTLLGQPGKAPRYASLLQAADTLRVTADSVAMVSDAIWTGKPVAVVPIGKSPLGRIVTALNDRLRPDRPLYPRDLRRFWNALCAIGVTEHPARPRTSADQHFQAILDRVRPILDSIP